MKDSSKIFTYIIAVGIGLLMTKTEKIMGTEVAKMLGEPYRVCRRLNILRDYSDEKTNLYPRN